MTVLRVGPESLARTRFGLSPMIETVAALILLGGGQCQPWLSAWVQRHREEFAALAAEPVLGAMSRMLSSTRWLPDFLTPPPAGMQTTFAEEIAIVTATPLHRVRADLAHSAGGTLPAVLDREDLPIRLGAALDLVWSRFLRPDWPRRKAMLERDVVQRAGLLATYGWARALDGLSSSVHWLGDGRIEVNNWDYPEQQIGSAELLLVPCGLGASWLCLEPPRAYVVIYPARGAASPTPIATRAGLDRLIGGTRATILRSLDVPASTSQLVAELGLSLATVNEHLAVLRDAGIVGSVRTGRSVLYHRTGIGERLVKESPFDRVYPDEPPPA